MKKQLLLLLIPALMSACSNGSTSQSTSSSSSTSSSMSSSSSSTSSSSQSPRDLSYKYEDLESDPDYEAVSEGCSLNGWFLEVETGRCLATNKKYEFKFNSSLAGNPSFRVKSSHTEHATVEMKGDNATFYLNTLTAGDTILSVYNANEILCYRHVVRIRPFVEEEDVLKTAFDADHFETLPEACLYTGNWKFTMLNKDSGKSIVDGEDEMETEGLTVSFELTFSEYVDSTELYVYKCTNEENYSTNTYVSFVAFSCVADVAYIYYSSTPSTADSDSHLLTIMYNSNCEYIYK